MKTWIVAVAVVLYSGFYVGSMFGAELERHANTKHVSILEKY